MPAAARRGLGQWLMLHKTFRPYDQHTLLLMPPSLTDWVADDGLVAYLNDLGRRARPGPAAGRARRAQRQAAQSPGADAHGAAVRLRQRRQEQPQARAALSERRELHVPGRPSAARPQDHQRVPAPPTWPPSARCSWRCCGSARPPAWSSSDGWRWMAPSCAPTRPSTKP